MAELVEQIKAALQHFSLRKAASLIMELAALGNTYFDFQKPWVLAKDEKLKDRLNNCLLLSLECIKNLALAVSPLIPTSAQKIWEFLGFDSKLEKQDWEKIRETALPADQKLGAYSVLFRRIEDDEIEEEISKLKKTTI